MSSVVNNLKESATDGDDLIRLFPNTFKFAKDFYTEDVFPLLTSKLVYPYDYMNSKKRLEQTELPKISDFHSILTDERISQADYDSFVQCYNKLGCNNLGDLLFAYQVRKREQLRLRLRRLRLRQRMRQRLRLCETETE